MNRFGLVLLFGGVLAVGVAQETVLFDGKDTSEWVNGAGGEFPSRSWKVEDGALVAIPGTAGHNLFSRRQYSDFELTWEWKIPEGGNSGVKYQCVEGRVDPDLELVLQGTAMTVYFTLALVAAALVILWRKPKWTEGVWARRSVLLVAGVGFAWAATVGLSLLRERAVAKKRPPGFEYQMIDDKTQKDELHRTASLYDLLEPKGAKPRPLGEWNSSRIVVAGKHVEHWLNGEQVLVYEMGSPELKAAVAKSKFRRIEGFAEKAPRGHLMLQYHETAAYFRNIRIRENPEFASR